MITTGLVVFGGYQASALLALSGRSSFSMARANLMNGTFSPRMSGAPVGLYGVG